MGVDNFEICLTNGEIFQAGQVIKGHVKLKISNGPFKISKGLKLCVEGRCCYRYGGDGSGGAGTAGGAGEEMYINQTLYLLNEGDQEIPEGGQEFPFAYQLPSNLPSSLETQSFHVSKQTYLRYSIKATIDRTLLKDLERVLEFSVIGSFDLNQYPSLNEPVLKEDSKDAGFCCFKAGKVNATVKLSHRGFVPGERVKVFADVNNESSKPINKLMWRLWRKISFFSKDTKPRQFFKESSDLPVHDETELDLFQIEKAEKIRPGESKTWDWTEVCIPPTVPSNGLHKNVCEILKIEYFLVLTCDIPNAVDLHVKVPVEIGTVPLLRKSQDPNDTAPSTSFKQGGRFKIHGFDELVPDKNMKNFNPSYLHYNFN